MGAPVGVRVWRELLDRLMVVCGLDPHYREFLSVADGWGRDFIGSSLLTACDHLWLMAHTKGNADGRAADD